MLVLRLRGVSSTQGVLLRNRGVLPTSFLAALVATLAACGPNLESCDQALAETIVYDEEGFPAYEGQALIITHCGGGGFCHAADIPQESRYGTPAGLELDLRLASYSSAVEAAEVERLAHDQLVAHTHRASIFTQVRGSTMPPHNLGEMVAANGPSFARGSTGLGAGLPLPELTSSEGLAILRNWLACDLPVVERTVDRGDGQPNTVGTTVAAVAPRVPVEPFWSSIHDRMIAPSCAIALCHDGMTNAGGLDLTGGSAVAYAALVGVAPASQACASTGTPRVVPGDSAGSLLVHKLKGFDGSAQLVCGFVMPPIGNRLASSTIAAVEAWIDSGAQNN